MVLVPRAQTMRRYLTLGTVLYMPFLLLSARPAAADDLQTLPTVEVIGTSGIGMGTAGTASEGTVSQQQLEQRPVYREGELLESTPGLIVTQHSGEGKANQYFLRGFNLDHGTDFEITLDDMPVNMRSHAHGQGYSDLNFMIPELVSGLTYRKGPYFADEGDFAAAGAAHIGYVDRLDKDLAEVGAGSFGYARALGAMSRPTTGGNVLAAAEGYHLDGPWVHPDDYKKGNLVLRYSDGSADNGWTASAMAYSGAWNSTDQSPERAINNGQLSYWDSIDHSDGGNAQRFSLSGRLVRSDADSRLTASAYVIKSELDLYNNFTYFLFNPVQGDQFHQHDDRIVVGGKTAYTMFGSLAGRDTENTLGTELRADHIHLGLFQTQDRQYLSTDRVDQVDESSVGFFGENKTQWLDKVRTVVGLREDLFYATDHADNPLNGGTATGTQLSPKGSLILGPWAKTEFYVSAGEGFHSNDVRSATATVEPTTFNNNVLGVSGQPQQKFPLLEKAVGEEVGVRTMLIPHLQSSIAIFRLHLASEQVFSGDAGDTSASGPSTRTGIEFANTYTPMPGLVIDGDLAVSKARFDQPVDDGITIGRYIAGSPAMVASLGVTYNGDGPWFGGVQYEFFGPRPLTDDNSVRSPPTNLVNARLGYKLTPAAAVRLDINNLLDTRTQQISYYYASRLQNEPMSLVGTGVNDVHLHPAEPFGARLSVTVRF